MSACVRLCVRTKICFLACMSLLRNIDFSGRDPFRLQADYNYSHMRKSIPRSQFKIRMRKTIFARSLKRCLFSHADLLRSHVRKCLQCFFYPLLSLPLTVLAPLSPLRSNTSFSLPHLPLTPTLSQIR